MSRELTHAQAVNEGLHQAMAIDDNVICYGLGVTDPKGVFGTTLGLQEKYGKERVFDMPTSENAMTGVAIGAALNGIRPVMTHQRLDFFLLAMDQLVNNAAKWHYMFGGKTSVPITIRLIIGRGWGQGPTHSQNLQAWFAHIPGLKVVVPTTAKDAKGTLISSIFDDNPVLFLEHRWLHNSKSEVPEGDFRIPLGKADVKRSGEDITIVSMSYMTVEALHAAKVLQKMGISCEVIDLLSLNPIDWETIYKSIQKTGRLLALDTAQKTCSVSAEVIARICIKYHKTLKTSPKRITLPDQPTPTSQSLTNFYYKRCEEIVNAVCGIFKVEPPVNTSISGKTPLDVPGDWFTGPF